LRNSIEAGPTGSHKPSIDAISRALEARHIAVFGASATPGKWGYAAVDLLLKGGYQGELTLINPRGGHAFDRDFVTAEKARGADLAVVATPGGLAVDIIRNCGELEIPMAVFYAAGFAEVGGRNAQDELLSEARRLGVRLLGPNCVGFLATPSKINITLDPGLPPGNVSLVTQSGSVGLHLGHRLRQLGGGFDVMMTLGNKADVGFSEAVAALVKRKTTESIVLYLERLDEGDQFLDTLAEAAKELPIVALLSGQTEIGRKATMSHTGSLVGNWERAKGLLQDCGVFVCERLEAVAGVAAGARRAPKPRGSNVFVMCDGGGPCVMLSDALARAKFELPAPTARLVDRLVPIVGDRVARTNPLDFAGAADTDMRVYSKVFEQVAASGEFDIVVVGGIVGGIGSYWGPAVEEAELRMVDELVATSRATNQMLMVQSSYATDNTRAVQAFRAAGIPCLEWPDEIANALRARVKAEPASPKQKSESKSVELDQTLVDYTEKLANALTRRAIAHALGEITGPKDLPKESHPRWVLRLDGIAHKTDAGAIRVGVKEEHLRRSIDELTSLGRRWTDEPVVRAGAFVEHDEELIVTFFRDKAEGSGLVLGAGGTDTEHKADVAISRLPRDRSDIVDLLSRSKEGRRVLARYQPDQVTRVADCVLALAQLFEVDFPELAELEVNPIGLTPNGAVVLDVLPTMMSVN
jgi:acyl-CoA synthetase (NDP forming)